MYDLRVEIFNLSREYAKMLMKSTTPDNYNPTISGYLSGIDMLIENIEPVLTDKEREETKQTFENLKLIKQYCNSEEFMTENWGVICQTITIFVQFIEITYQMLLKQRGKCPVCRRKVSYLPMPFYYSQMQEKYGCKPHLSEMNNVDKYECPICNATDRDRMIVALLTKFGLQHAKKEISLLQIAPSIPIDRWIRGEANEIIYHTTDLYMQGVTFQSDITDMKQVADASYDYFICSHVLEHVKDDRKAMRELMRILKTDGIGIFLVPIVLDVEKTEEEWGLSPEENWKRFGQDDHCRQYAKKDLLNRLKSEGISVLELGKDFFGEEFFHEMGMVDTATLYLLSKKEFILQELQNRHHIISKQVSEPLVSVVMSSYNHEQYVAETIESVLNQTYKNIEFLVADDGSSDNTTKIIECYKENLTHMQFYKDNLGERISALIPLVKGKYIAHIHSDDCWEPDKLEKQIEYLEEHEQCGVCTTWADYVGNPENSSDNGSIFWRYNQGRTQWLHRLLTVGNCLCFPSSVWRSELYSSIVPTCGNRSHRQLGDYCAWLHILLKESFYVIPEILVHMKRHTTSTSMPTLENLNRHKSSEAYLVYRIISEMDTELFVDVFFKELVNKNAKKPEEISCEKFFVLKGIERKHIRIAAIFYYFDIYRNQANVKCLRENYGFTENDFYDYQAEVKL